MMYEHKKPYGFIAESEIVGIMKRPDGKFFIKDNIGNYLETDENTYLNLKERGIAEICQRTKHR